MGFGLYHYRHKDRFYTGTPGQPGTLSFFVIPKEDKNSLKIRHKFSSVNSYFILGIFTGIFRVTKAVSTLFKEFSQIDRKKKNDPHRYEVWNAGKNLCRGMVEITVVLGVFLFIYDILKSKLIIEKQIRKELEERKAKGSIISDKGGIALDGKILCLIDLADFNPKNRVQQLSKRLQKVMNDEHRELFEFNKIEGKKAFEAKAKGYKWKENTLTIKELIEKRKPWTIVND